MYGAAALKPNHHYGVHTSDQLVDFGPIYNIWNFLGERLNKILKTFNTNGWVGGQLEVSMMRAFARDVSLNEMVCLLVISKHNLFADNSGFLAVLAFCYLSHEGGLRWLRGLSPCC